MDAERAVKTVRQEQHFLNNILNGFTAEHENFKPEDGSLTVAQQVRHIALTLQWFMDGILDDEWMLDFEAHEVEIKKPVTLGEAKAELAGKYDALVKRIEAGGDALAGEMTKPNEIMGEVPRIEIVHHTAEHTAHHRGALAVYQRMLGVTPKMVYAP